MIRFLSQYLSSPVKKNTALGVAGDTTVIKNILTKKNLLKKGDSTHETIKPLLLLSPGAMGGAIEAGVAVGLEKLQLFDAFDTVLGISAGAAVGYYGLAGESAVGSQIIYKDLIEHQVVSYKHPYKFLDIDGIEKIMRSKDINIQKLKDTRSDFYVLATASVTGEPTLLNVKQHQDMLSPVIASMCLPILDGGKEVLINGIKYVDGAASNALPLTIAVERFEPTDILVILPVSLKEQKAFAFSIRMLVESGRLFTPLKNHIINQYSVYNNELQYVTGKKHFQNTRIMTIYVKQSPVSLFTTDIESLRESIVATASYTHQVFTSVE